MKSDFSVQNNVVNVCCSYLSMVFPYIGNVKYPHGRTYQTTTFQIQAPKDRKRQRLRYISQNDRLPLLSPLFSLEATRSFHSVMSDSWSALPWKYDPGQMITEDACCSVSGFSRCVVRIFPEVRPTFSSSSSPLPTPAPPPQISTFF